MYEQRRPLYIHRSDSGEYQALRSSMSRFTASRSTPSWIAGARNFLIAGLVICVVSAWQTAIQPHPRASHSALPLGSRPKQRTLGEVEHLPAEEQQAVVLRKAKRNTGRPQLEPPGSLHLTRAHQVEQLNRRIDEDSHVGICQQGVALLDGVPPYVCPELYCLQSPATGKNYDVWMAPFNLMTQSIDSQGCPQPRGGQRSVAANSQPLVSFIVTMHNSVHTTARCLVELFRTAHEVDSAEFIVVDDGSTEDTELVKQLLNNMNTLFGAQVTYLRNEKPIGYGPANNKGIMAAQGEFVALINNDMFVGRGWLAALVRTFQMRPKAGIVGPLFFGDKGLVTEAGGVLWSDGSAANVARGSQLGPMYNHLRIADYISAACVMFRKKVYQQLGGFDPQFNKGYYEDTDLAMSVTNSGLEVLFQPLAVVYHQEGGTFGTDETSSLKRDLMAQNGALFKNKWRDVLQKYHCPPSLGLLPTTHRGSSISLLWVDDIVPEPDRDSGSVRNVAIMRALLTEGYGITFLPSVPRHPKYEVALRDMGVAVLPAAPVDQYSLTSGGKCVYDVILVARRAIFQASEGALKEQCPDAPIIYDTVDLHFLREAREALTSKLTTSTADSQQQQHSVWDFKRLDLAAVTSWMESSAPATEETRRRRDLELRLMEDANLTLVVSPDEVDLLHHYRPELKIKVLSNIYDVPDRVPPSGAGECARRSGALFVGNMNHLPNRQALEQLVTIVLPAVLAKLPSKEREAFTLHIVGSNVVPERLVKLMESSRNVAFYGYVTEPQLRMMYSMVRVAVAPLLSGAGVKGKIGQAMMLGTPVVATPVAVEGMFVVHGESCMVADNTSDFAEAIVRLHQDCALWGRLVQGGHANLQAHFSYSKARDQVLKALSEVGAGPIAWPERMECQKRAKMMTAPWNREQKLELKPSKPY